jgi:hypothetical protein
MVRVAGGGSDERGVSTGADPLVVCIELRVNIGEFGGNGCECRDAGVAVAGVAELSVLEF